MIRFYYRDQAGDYVEFTDRVDLSERNVVVTMNAEQGSVGTSTLTVDDPLGDWDVGGHRLVDVIEDTATFNRIWSGYTAEREITRDNPLVDGARKWEVTLVDGNSILARHIITFAEGNRPAETDVERMQWLSTSDAGNYLGDTTYLSTLNPVDMDAVDYRGQHVTDVIDDCSQQSGKNWYLLIIFDSPNYVFGTWYDFSGSEEFTSDIRISNLLSDIDGVVTFEPSLDTRLRRSPSRVYSGVYMPYDGGSVYRERAATEVAFALGGRDTNAPMVNVKTAAKANARADRFLLDISTEEDTITTTIRVPPSQVNDARAGMRIEAKFGHLPGYEAFVWMRILNRTVTFVTPEWYEVTLTLTLGATGVSAPGIAQWGNHVDDIILDHPATPGNTLIMAVSKRDPGAPPDPILGGWTNIAKAAHGEESCAMWYRVITADETGVTDFGDEITYPAGGAAFVSWAEITGTYAGIFAENNDIARTSDIECGGSVTPTGGSSVLIFGLASRSNQDVFGMPTVTPAAGITELGDFSNTTAGFAPFHWFAYRIVTNASGSYKVEGTEDDNGINNGINTPATYPYSGITAVFE